MLHFQFLCLFACLFVTTADADNRQIEEIREYYKQISSETKRCELNAQAGEMLDSDQCFLYLVEVSDNKLNRPVAAVGISQQLTHFWYDTSGFSHTRDSTLMPGDRELVRVEINGKRAAVEWYEEYLYKHGKLVFFFSKSGFGKYRFYFTAEKLISFLEENRPADFDDDRYTWKKEDWTDVLKNAACLQQSHMTIEYCQH